MSQGLSQGVVTAQCDDGDGDGDDTEPVLIPQKMGNEPAWVVDTNTYNLWQLGVIPTGLLSAEAAA